VRQRISEALRSIRDHKKEKARREHRQMVPRTPPPQEEEEENVTRSRITQLCWLEHELTAVHSRLEQARIELRRLMGVMSSVRTHEVSILKDDNESVELVRIQKGMEVCPRSTKALLMAMMVRSCVTDGEKSSEEEGLDWREQMRESTWAHQE
jgi:hypothetical protein